MKIFQCGMLLVLSVFSFALHARDVKVKITNKSGKTIFFTIPLKNHFFQPLKNGQAVTATLQNVEPFLLGFASADDKYPYAYRINNIRTDSVTLKFERDLKADSWFSPKFSINSYGQKDGILADTWFPADTCQLLGIDKSKTSMTKLPEQVLGFSGVIQVSESAITKAYKEKKAMWQKSLRDTNKVEKKQMFLHVLQLLDQAYDVLTK